MSDIERKLATIETINDIQPIPGADAIEVATVRGWKVVVKKGEFQVGDKCIYFEIDSFLPVRPEFEFLRKSSFKRMGDKEGFRLRTIKLRGQVSQGLVVPLKTLFPRPPVTGSPFLPEPFPNWGEVGFDVTRLLNVVKYEPPIPAQLAGKIRGNFPSHTPKTDEERVQNMPEIVQRRGVLYYASEKIDGSSCTVYLKDGTFGVCSRNLDLLETEDNTFWKTVRALGIEEKLRSLNKNISIQGELLGEGIQDNKYGLKGHTLRFFRAFDIDRQEYYHFNNFVELINSLGLQTVPIVSFGMELPETVEELIAFADKPSELNPNIPREGVVFVSINLPERISFKAISNEFLLKYGD